MGAYDFSYAASDGVNLVLNMSSGLPSLLGIAGYILTALALYSIASRRGINHPWLAWIPMVNCWLVGSLSDQYRYVVKGESKAKRKTLLILNIVKCVLTLAILIAAVILVFKAVNMSMRYAGEMEIFEAVIGSAVSVLLLCLPLAGVAIAYAVIYYMALYDVYKSLDPDNSVTFLVLSILFSVTEPFFLFCNRNKELGMPPRRQEPVYEEPVYQEPDYGEYL